MRSSQVSILACLVAGSCATPFDLEARQGCGNNCARAVIAGGFPNRPTKADCSSYLAVTTTPATVTATVTVDATTVKTSLATEVIVSTAVVTNTVTVPPAVDTLKRRATAKALPTYASACKDPAAYVNACSCIGVTPYTVEAPAPSTTVTVTATQTNVIASTETIFTATTVTTVTTKTVAPEPTTIITNGGFEKGAPLQDWNLSGRGTPFSVSPSQAGRVMWAWGLQYLFPVTAETGESWLSQRVSGLVPGAQYELTGYIRFSESTDASCYSEIYFTTDSARDFPMEDNLHPSLPKKYSTGQAEPNVWQMHVGRVVVHASEGQVVHRLTCQAARTKPMEMYFDEFKMERVPPS